MFSSAIKQIVIGDFHISVFDRVDIVFWDNGLVGNYWSDYKGQGTYVIAENNVDNYPLMER